MRKDRVLVLVVCLMLGNVLLAQDTTKPWTFWYWMYGAVSRAGIHADLKGMKEVGLGGCYLMPIRGSVDRPEFQGKADQHSANFWDMVDYSFQQADSLGLEMGIHICDGFALAGSPVIIPAESMQKVVWTDTVVTGNVLGCNLRQPESYQGYYEDIACIAFPVDHDIRRYSIAKNSPQCSGGITTGDDDGFRASTQGTILCDLGCVDTLRSLEIIPSGNNIQSQRLVVETSVDGQHFRMVSQLEPCRQGWQSTGPHFTYAIMPTQTRYLRFSWTPEGTEPGSEELDAAKWKPTLKLKDIIVSTEPKINQWEGKSGMSWRVSETTSEEEMSRTDCVPMDRVIYLTLKNDRVVACSENQSETSGKWRIFRFGHTSNGQMNATAGKGKGLEVDKFNSEAVDKLFNDWYGAFLHRPHSNVVKYLHIDSWECGTQNWGKDFAKKFERRRGYDLIPYLPLYAGIPMTSVGRSEKVLYDIRQTVNDLVNECFFKHLEGKAHAAGRLVTQESIAPTFVADGMEHYKYADSPMGEYWLNSPTHDKPNDMLDAISGAHVYGKNIVRAEGFTEVRGTWNETPAMIKPLLDRNFALGMNQLVFHVNAHNPWMDRSPGMTLDGIGLFFQRDNIWYPEAKGLVNYVIRSQKMLQQGWPVVDIAVFTGEEMPSRSLTPDKLTRIIPSVLGAESVEKDSIRLKNIGQPMEESPVGVIHSSGIFSMDEWINALHGYQYDSMNRDALLNATTLKDGKLFTKGGNSYRVLIVPGRSKMNPEGDSLSSTVRQRLEECRRVGVLVIDKPYIGADFLPYGISPDAILPENVAYTHRATNSSDIYFISNQMNMRRTIEASFRVNGREVILYDASTDSWKDADKVIVNNGRTQLSLALPSFGSVFVVFTNGKKHVKALPEPMREEVVNSLWNVEFLRNGVKEQMSKLSSWTESKSDKVKYYSGTARYQNNVKLGNIGKGKVVLSLGSVRDVAHVYVNGIDCGIAWTAPYEVDITKATRKGINRIEINVVNTWVNALKGADEGKSPYEGIWTNAKYRMKEGGLLPAGLLGPVTIKY